MNGGALSPQFSRKTDLLYAMKSTCDFLAVTCKIPGTRRIQKHSIILAIATSTRFAAYNKLNIESKFSRGSVPFSKWYSTKPLTVTNMKNFFLRLFGDNLCPCLGNLEPLICEWEGRPAFFFNVLVDKVHVNSNFYLNLDSTLFQPSNVLSPKASN